MGASNEGRAIGHSLKLLVDVFFEVFALAKRSACHTCSFGVAPHQLVGIQVGRVPRQEIQGEFAIRGCDVLLHQCLLVRRQSIDHHVHSFLSAMHQLFQQLYKQFDRQADLPPTAVPTAMRKSGVARLIDFCGV
jgi:hypothetical protein